jgi:hypothetical protein
MIEKTPEEIDWQSRRSASVRTAILLGILVVSIFLASILLHVFDK